MVSMARAFVCATLAAVALSTSDNADLVQGRLHASLSGSTDPEPASNVTENNTSAPTAAPYEPVYRVTFKSTWGDDHVCLTELEFRDVLNATLEATFVEASSCWGCAVSCGNCIVDYGNPLVLFDGKSDDDTPQAYFCTDFGSFDKAGESGAQSVSFKLNGRPEAFALLRPDAKGSAIARRFELEVLQPDGNDMEKSIRQDLWSVLRDANDMEKSTRQEFSIEFQSGPVGKWWQYESPLCMSDMKLPAKANGTLDVEYTTIPAADGRFQNNGQGVFLDNALGSLRIGETAYAAKHMHFVFPSGRKLGKEGEKFVIAGEVHIAHQKPDGKGTEHLHQDGLAIVVIPLRLPAEDSEAVSKTMQWFEKMDLTNLPQEGAAKKLAENFTLNIFDEQLNGGYYQLDCQEEDKGNEPIWFLLNTPAYITGKVVQAFKDSFPYDSVGKGGSLNSTYLVDQKLEVIGYDKRGKEHLVGISQPDKSDWGPLETTTPMPEGVEWRANAGFVGGFGEFMPMGEWYFPPGTE